MAPSRSKKGTNFSNDMEEPVVTIRRKYLDNSQGQYTGSTGWFNIAHEWLKEMFLHLKRTSIIKKIN